MLDYLQAKWTRIDHQSRSELVVHIRASEARLGYYHERAKFFEGINRQTCVQYVLATVRRQQYYELKLHYCEKALVAQERERFGVYDGKSKEYMEDKVVEEAGEEQERHTMGEEQDYTHSLHMARIEETFAQEKNAAVLDAEEWYRHAARAARTYREAAQGQSDIEAKYAEFQEEMDEGAHKRVYMMLKEQYDHLGKTELYPFEDGRNPADSHLTLVAAPLRPLPPDMGSVVMMKRYIHKGKAPPKRDIAEGYDLSSQNNAADELQPTAGTSGAAEQQAAADPNGEPIQASVELELSIDPSTLSPEEQVKFLNEMASFVGVDAASLSIHSIKK